MNKRLYFARSPVRHSGRASLWASRVPMPARTEPRPPVVDVAAHTAGSIASQLVLWSILRNNGAPAGSSTRSLARGHKP
jgi:hypothetical protein